MSAENCDYRSENEKEAKKPQKPSKNLLTGGRLIDLVHQAGAQVVGAGIVIEKAFQPGGALIRGKGVRVESLARIESMDEEDGITFCD